MKLAPLIIAAVVVGLSAGVRAELATSGPASGYAVAAEVRLPAEALARRFDPQLAGVTADGSAKPTPIGEQTRIEFTSLARRMFVGTGPADLILEVNLRTVDFRPGATFGSRVSVEHEVAALSGSGAEIRRWRIRGDATVLSTEGEAIASGFARAIAESAQNFERDFRDSAEVRRWMEQRGIRAVAVRAPWPERGDHLGFVEGGAGLLQGGDGSSMSLLARVGASGRRYVIQAVFTRSQPGFSAQPVFGTANGEARLEATSLGIEAGGVWRLGPLFELRGGLGAHLIWGHAKTSYFLPNNDPRYNSGPQETSFWFTQQAASLFAALQYTNIVLPRGGRVRVGLEARTYLTGDVTFAELRRSISPAGPMVGLFAGVEMPWLAPAPKGAR